MNTQWCFKCKMNVPMLDDEEFKKAKELYNLGLSSIAPDRFEPLLEYYNNLTGFGETDAEEIMHHQISQYGPICENCGKPLKTPTATFCISCGAKRS